MTDFWANDYPGKLMALDVGLARIGVATCDPLGITVTPLTVMTRRSRREDFDQLAALITDEAVEGIVCGLPLNMDGSEGEQAQTTRRWARRLLAALEKLLAQPPALLFWDERLTTYAAEEMIEMAHLPPSYQRIGEDALAAGVILRSFLDARQRNADLTQYGTLFPTTTD